MHMRVVDGGAHVFSRAKLDAEGRVTVSQLLAALGDGLVQLAAPCAAG